MEQARSDPFVKEIFTATAPHIDLLNSLFSLGLCHWWRRKAVQAARIRPDSAVLDLCTGTADLAVVIMEKLGPQGSLTGVDFCPEMLALGREKVRRKSTSRPVSVTLLEGDAQHLAFPDNSFDRVTVAYGIRNVPDTRKAIQEVRRVLKPGGTFMCLELTKPAARWLTPAYDWYTFKLMPAVAAFVMKKGTPYAYLPRSIDNFHPIEEFLAILSECGFSRSEAKPLTFGINTIFTAVKS